MSYIDKMKVGDDTYEIKDSNAATPADVSSAVDSEEQAREQALAALKEELEAEIAEKASSADLAPVATSGDYGDLENTPTIGAGTLTIQKNGLEAGTFNANATEDEVINIVVPTSAADVSALPSSTKYGASLELSIDSSTFVMTATLKDQDGNTLGTAPTIDLPLESMVVGGSYDAQTKKVILTLKSGDTIEFSVADLVSGLQSEINANNKLSADYVDDTNTTHKFTSAAEKATWNGKQDALTFDSTPTSGSTNPVTSGGVYNVIGDVESVLTTLISGNGATEEES